MCALLEDAAWIRKVGTAEFRKGIDSLAMNVGDKHKQGTFEKGTLFLCSAF